MLELIHLSLPDLIRSVGYLGIFLIAFAESGVPFGFMLPGDSLLFTAGFLASQGFLHIGYLVIIATTAAILGDSVGYWIGAKTGEKLLGRPNAIIFSERHVKKTEEFYAKYGTKAIVLARFMPIVRTFVPIFAGIGSMRYRTFLTYNIIGGILWGTGVPLVGYFLGSLFPKSEHYLTLIILIIIFLSFLPVAVELWRDRRRINE